MSSAHVTAERRMAAMPSIIVAALVSILLASCTALRPQPDAAHGTVDRLYFGRSVPGGGEVTPTQWDGFLAEIVTPAFPDGLTWWDAYGQWNGAAGLVRERTFVLEIASDGGAAVDERLLRIVNEYRARFHQQSVLWTRTPAGIRF